MIELAKCVRCRDELITYNNHTFCVKCLKNNIKKYEEILKNLKDLMPPPSVLKNIQEDMLCPHCRVPLQPPIQACPECGFD